MVRLTVTDDKGSEASDEVRVTVAALVSVSGRVTYDYVPLVHGPGVRLDYRPDDESWGRGTRPVINVSWEDAQAYVSWLSSQTGEAYRLMSEAEWEYVARAGSQTAYSWGSDIGSNRANCEGCGSQWDPSQTAPVGSFQANAYGVHDMHGNVWEWVEDCGNFSYAGTPSDGSAWRSVDCSRRVLRGGSWNYDPRNLRSAFRYRYTSGLRCTSSSGSVWPGRSRLESLPPYVFWGFQGGRWPPLGASSSRALAPKRLTTRISRPRRALQRQHTRKAQIGSETISATGLSV